MNKVYVHVTLKRHSDKMTSNNTHLHNQAKLYGNVLPHLRAGWPCVRKCFCALAVTAPTAVRWGGSLPPLSK